MQLTALPDDSRLTIADVHFSKLFFETDATVRVHSLAFFVDHCQSKTNLYSRKISRLHGHIETRIVGTGHAEKLARYADVNVSRDRDGSIYAKVQLEDQFWVLSQASDWSALGPYAFVAGIENGHVPVSVGEKMHILDLSTGDLSSASFDECAFLSEGMTTARLGHTWYVIDYKGSILATIGSDFLWVGSFDRELAPFLAKDNNGRGYVNRGGKVVHWHKP